MEPNMEPNIYEDPGQYSATRPPPSSSTHTTTGRPDFTTEVLRKQTQITVDRAQISPVKPASDPYSCHFEETFKEAKEPKVPDIIHGCYKLAYRAVLGGFYTFLSVLIGPILIVLFAIILGLTSFMITYVFSPIMRCFGMCFAVWELCITGCLDCYLAPIFRVMGSCCSRMVIRYQKVPSGEVIHV